MNDLLDLMRPPPILQKVNCDLGVITGRVREVLRLPQPRMAWDTARIELHPHSDGLWMWSTSFCADQQGSGYRVGPKWGKFAQTRDDALHWARAELLDRLGPETTQDKKRIRQWAERLT